MHLAGPYGVVTISIRWALAYCQVWVPTQVSLRDPEYLAMHTVGAPASAKLQQAVMEVLLQQKLDALWSLH